MAGAHAMIKQKKNDMSAWQLLTSSAIALWRAAEFKAVPHEFIRQVNQSTCNVNVPNIIIKLDCRGS
jgi:hypothetical protein